MDIPNNVQAWLGKTFTHVDLISENKVQQIAATLCCADPITLGQVLPSGWHWLFHTPSHRLDQVGVDGHPQKGLSLPPIDLPQRMWGGSNIIYHQPLKVGETVAKASTIKNIQYKAGRSGQLALVTVEHHYQGDLGGSIIDIQTIVYREKQNLVTSKTAVESQFDPNFDWTETITPTPVLLFHYSALMMNGHRIHYDRTYCMEEELYPGLVVQGPLTATLLMELVRKNTPDTPIKHFEFKGLSPLFDGYPFEIFAKKNAPNEVSLWALTPNQTRAMLAKATLSSSKKNIL